MVRFTNEFRTEFGDLATWIKMRLEQIPDGSPDVWGHFKWYSQIEFEPKARDVVRESVLAPVLRVADLDTSTLWINGQFRPDEPDSIYLSSDIVSHRAELGDDRYKLLLESTILHELVHWGNFHKGDIDRGDATVEWGKAFEMEAYRQDIDRYWLGDGRSACCGTGAVMRELSHGGGNRAGAPPLADPPAIVGGAPFARSDAAVRVWPIRTLHASKHVISYLGSSGQQFGEPARSFFARRSGRDEDSIADDRHHVGLDLFGFPDDEVVACEAGEIVNIHPFYQDTWALLVLCDSGIVINYGEVANNSWGSLQIGSRVIAGTPIARIGRLERGSMCHFETYTGETRQTTRWKWNALRPDNILNPTRYLLDLPRQ